MPLIVHCFLLWCKHWLTGPCPKVSSPFNTTTNMPLIVHCFLLWCKHWLTGPCLKVSSPISLSNTTTNMPLIVHCFLLWCKHWLTGPCHKVKMNKTCFEEGLPVMWPSILATTLILLSLKTITARKG